MLKCNRSFCCKKTKDGENSFALMEQGRTTQMTPMLNDQGKKKRNIISNTGGSVCRDLESKI